MHPDTTDQHTFPQVCGAIGISYRRLDHLTRNGVLPGLSKGSGHPRVLDTPTVMRLAVAAALTDAMPVGAGHDTASSLWPRLADVVLNGPEPPAAGYAILDTVGTIRYVPYEPGGWVPDLQPDDVPVGATAVHYDTSDVADLLAPAA